MIAAIRSKCFGKMSVEHELKVVMSNPLQGFEKLYSTQLTGRNFGALKTYSLDLHVLLFFFQMAIKFWGNKRTYLDLDT